MSDSYLTAKKIYLTAFKENYFINSLLYKKKYICKENWYGGQSKKIVFKKYKLVKWILIKKI